MKQTFFDPTSTPVLPTLFPSKLCLAPIPHLLP